MKTKNHFQTVYGLSFSVVLLLCGAMLTVVGRSENHDLADSPQVKNTPVQTTLNYQALTTQSFVPSHHASHPGAQPWTTRYALANDAVNDLRKLLMMRPALKNIWDLREPGAGELKKLDGIIFDSKSGDVVWVPSDVIVNGFSRDQLNALKKLDGTNRPNLTSIIDEIRRQEQQAAQGGAGKAGLSASAGALAKDLERPKGGGPTFAEMERQYRYEQSKAGKAGGSPSVDRYAPPGKGRD